MSVRVMKLVNGRPVGVVIPVETGNTILKTSDYSVSITDRFILVDCSGGNVTLTIPGVPTDGQIFTFKKIDNTSNKMIIAHGDPTKYIENALGSYSTTVSFEDISIKAYNNNYYKV